MRESRTPWWGGARGEWYVAVQLVLIFVVFLAPRTLPGLPEWPDSLSGISRFAGTMLMAVGALLFFASAFSLGPNLTPLPLPKEQGTLVQSGPYRLVRHPIYAGGLALVFGWALLVQGLLTLGYAALLLIFLDIKSTREERWLAERFPEYADYKRRVRKLIPFIY